MSGTLPYVIHASMHPASQPYIPIYLYLHTYRTNTFILKYVSPYDKKLYTNCIILHLLSSLYISNQHTVYESNVWSPRSSLILSSARVLRPLQPPSLRQRFWRSLKVQKMETVCLVNHEIYLAGSVYSVYKKLYTHTMYYVYFS